MGRLAGVGGVMGGEVGKWGWGSGFNGGKRSVLIVINDVIFILLDEIVFRDIDKKWE